ncbi:hypothetical protein BS17DRAFT_783242 [Gyrodon lividus]|nr:hypothetical protein BS17DRAFT_783242 [Gyrodon lividus]
MLIKLHLFIFLVGIVSEESLQGASVQYLSTVSMLLTTNRHYQRPASLSVRTTGHNDAVGCSYHKQLPLKVARMEVRLQKVSKKVIYIALPLEQIGPTVLNAAFTILACHSIWKSFYRQLREQCPLSILSPPTRRRSQLEVLKSVHSATLLSALEFSW